MKKNKKQRFISDKISELRAEGKNQQQSIAIALSMAENMLKEGGDVELPKYQGNLGSNTFYQKSYKDPVIGQFYGQDISNGFKGYDFNNPIQTPLQYPSTTYNPKLSDVKVNNRQASIGQLDLNNTLFTEPATQMPNATVATTTTEKPKTTASTPQLPKVDNSVSTITSEQLKDDSYIVEDSIKPEFQYLQGDNNLDGVVDENDNIDKNGQVIEQSVIPQQKPIQFANPYGGVDLNAASALFGQSIQQGDTAMGIASGAKLGLGLARNFMSGCVFP